ncbi:YybH family protein [Actinomycetospora sp. CA-053990]|uniref:YybH family protein n=1 Tax=Actinomycetospora sp. CA-053990 TaxID=3239891 RepID=UPI003D8DEB24
MMTTSGPNLIEQFAKYFNSGDLESLVLMYEDGAAFIPEPGTVLNDAAGLRASLQAFLDLKGTITIVSTTEAVNNELALTHSHWRIDLPDGGSMEHTSAEVSRRQADGTWKYALDNPFGGDVLS